MYLTKPAIAIAFERTISDSLLGADMLNNESVAGAMDALQELSWKYRLVVVTTSPSSKFSEISDWIMRNRGGRSFQFEVTNVKPPALYHIDSRALRFESWPQVLSVLSG